MRDTLVLRRLRRTELGDEGLTLVEMVVALVVLSIVLTAMAAALIGSMVASNTAELRTRAVQLAAKYLEADQSVNWKFLGHRSTDLPGQALYPATGGESLVRLAADVDSSTVTDIPTSGPVAVSYAGTTFNVATYVTWVGSSATTPNDGSTYAAKRITIIITWAPRDGSHTLTTVALRAPSAAEMKPPSTLSVPIAVSNAYATPAQTLSAVGVTTVPIVFNASTTQPASTVVASYQLADGTQQQVAMVGDALLTTWAGTLAAGAGPFAAGSLAITITATAPSGTQVTYSTNLKLAAYAAPALSLSSPSAVIGSGLPADAVLATGGSGYVTAQPLTVSVTASTTPQGITASYPISGGGQSTPVALSYDAVSGAYTYTFPAGTGPLAPGNLPVTFAATPAGGGAAVTATASVTLTAPSLGALSVSALTMPAYATPATVPTWPWSTAQLCVNAKSAPETSYGAPVVYVMVKNVSATDLPTVTLSNVTAGSATGTVTYVKSDSNGMTFMATWPATVTLSSYAPVVTVQVSRAADSTTLAPAYTSTISPYWKNKASSC